MHMIEEKGKNMIYFSQKKVFKKKLLSEKRRSKINELFYFSLFCLEGFTTWRMRQKAVWWRKWRKSKVATFRFSHLKSQQTVWIRSNWLIKHSGEIFICREFEIREGKMRFQSFSPQKSRFPISNISGSDRKIFLKKWQKYVHREKAFEKLPPERKYDCFLLIKCVS